MDAPLLVVRVVSGSRSGDVIHLRSRSVRVGRHPEADLRFDPERERAVSGWHAELRPEAGRWWVRDLGSRNGTFVDGDPVAGSVPVGPGTEIRLGRDGPLLRVEGAEDVAALSHAPGAATSSASTAAGSGAAAERVRDDPESLRRIVLALGSALAVVLIGAAVVFAGRDAAWEEERARIEATLDSVLDASQASAGSMSARVEGLETALAESRERIRSLRSELEGASSVTDEEVESLRRRLQEATAALGRQQIAASLDFDDIEEANGRALARVFVEFQDGTVVTGTAFAVRSDGLLATTRHMLAGEEDDARPRRIAVQFARSAQVYPATVVALSTDADIGLLRVERLIGEVPVVRGLNARPDTLASGIPLALLGFPLGGVETDEIATGQTAGLPTPLITAGVARQIGPDGLVVQGYGERGGSGSPIFDATGAVVGVLFGGRTDGATRTLFGEPVSALRSLLRGVRQGPG